MSDANHQVFVTGGTGYLGRRLIPELARRGHTVRALVRPGSVAKLSGGCQAVVGNALDRRSFAAAVPPSGTLVQLVGTPRPNPAKAREFREVDLVSARESAAAAAEAGARHLVYVSVAQPAPVMRGYVAVRAEGEAAMRATGLAATFLRPWYILGPGHLWPSLLLPAYWLSALLPPTRPTSRRLGLVRLSQMVAALVEAVEHPPEGVRIVEVPEIRRAPGRLARAA